MPSTSAFTPPPASLKQDPTSLVTASGPAKKKAKTTHSSEPKAEHGGNDSKTSAKKKVISIKLTDLPQVTLSGIAELTGDMSTALNVANASRKLMAAVQPWRCALCNNNIFVVKDADDKEDGKSGVSLADTSKELAARTDDHDPYFCGTCKRKSCGSLYCQYHIKCQSCGKLECELCANWQDCTVCREDPYCTSCKAICDVCCLWLYW